MSARGLTDFSFVSVQLLNWVSFLRFIRMDCNETILWGFSATSSGPTYCYSAEEHLYGQLKWRRKRTNRCKHQYTGRCKNFQPSYFQRSCNRLMQCFKVWRGFSNNFRTKTGGKTRYSEESFLETLWSVSQPLPTINRNVPSITHP